VAVATGAVVTIVVGIVWANWRTLGKALVLRVLRTRAVVVIAACWHGRRTWTNGECRITAEHGNARSIFGATEGDHVTSSQDISKSIRQNDGTDVIYSPNFNGDDLSEMRIGVDEDPLDKIVAELIGTDLLVLAAVKTI